MLTILNLKLKIFLINLFLLFLPFISSAQTITGKITDTQNKKLEYVNIGIPLKNIGTVSDNNGNFNLKIDKNNLQDTMYFSILGYEKKCIPVNQLIENKNNIINLKETAYKISEVKISGNKFKSKKLGNDFRNPNRLSGFGYAKLGYEIGVVMKNKKEGFVENVGINIASCPHDTLFLRLNIYNFENKKITTQILKKPFYIELNQEEIVSKKGIIKINLRDYNLQVKSKFFVSVEIIKDYPNQEAFLFCDGVFSFSPTYTRMTSHGGWEKEPAFNIGINSTVIYKK